MEKNTLKIEKEETITDDIKRLGLFSLILEKLSSVYAMFNGYIPMPYDIDNQFTPTERRSFNWQQLNPFRGLIENRDFPLSKTRRLTFLKRLVEAYHVVVGKQSVIQLRFPTGRLSKKQPTRIVPLTMSQFYQKKFGVFDYFTLGIFPLANTLSAGVHTGFTISRYNGDTDNYWVSIAWVILLVMVGMPSLFISLIGNYFIKPLVGFIVTGLLTPILIAVAIINTLTYPDLSGFIVKERNDTEITLDTLKKEDNFFKCRYLLKPKFDDNQLVNINIYDSHYSDSREPYGMKVATMVLEPSEGNRKNDERSLIALLESGYGKFSKTWEHKAKKNYLRIRKNSSKEKAFTQGAILGLFDNKFSSDIAANIARFLDREAAGSIAQVNKKSNDSAKEQYYRVNASKRTLENQDTYVLRFM